MAFRRASGALIPCVLAIALLAACQQSPTGTQTDASGGQTAASVAGASATGVPDEVATAVDAIRARMLDRIPAERLADATPAEVLALADEDELQALSTGFLGFSVDAPAMVYVMLSPDSDEEPFWLAAQGFERTGLVATVDAEDTFRAWRKPFEAGEVGLGVHSIEGGVKPYFVLVGPAADGGEQPVVSGLLPERMGIATAVAGTRVFADDTDTLDAIDPALQGLALLQTLEKRENEAALLGWFRDTPHPAGADADHVVLTWAGDPATSQSIQWRTAPGSAHARLRYAAEGDDAAWTVVSAASAALQTPDVANDPKVMRHTVALEGLRPGTTYRYAIGDGQAWGEARSFTTAPAQPRTLQLHLHGRRPGGPGDLGHPGAQGARRAPAGGVLRDGRRPGELGRAPRRLGPAVPECGRRLRHPPAGAGDRQPRSRPGVAPRCTWSSSTCRETAPRASSPSGCTRWSMATHCSWCSIPTCPRSRRSSGSTARWAPRRPPGSSSCTTIRCTRPSPTTAASPS
ncbi:hypothetical protein FPZ22_06795 [Luteimonas granuli]|uniref:Purple acid phosphatase N-terminal domain-containing protein n=1 Tax=Luteimonas granuli TaxID=1176533 RepID=A0A518N449_9GAMM|nr:fibronectin type III domain-containing protein [Luteimonas granuli]QDW66637.1 hypothetical protein FPZ22_06795 [Luteimonas granuli]